MNAPLSLSLETRRLWTELSAEFERARRAFTDGSTNTTALADADARLKAVGAQLKMLRLLVRGEIAQAERLLRDDRRAG